MSKRRGKRKKSKGTDGLESLVMPFKPLKDEKGDFIPYCDFGYHKGIVLRPEVCEQRNCTNYYKLYINQNAK